MTFLCAHDDNSATGYTRIANRCSARLSFFIESACIVREALWSPDRNHFFAITTHSKEYQMSTVNGAYGPAYPEPLPPPPPPPPAPEVKADDPNASAEVNANADLDTQKEDQNTPANDQAAQPPITTPVKTDTIETKGVVDTKVANVAEAKSKAQTEFAQSLTEKIVAAAPKDVASTPEFRTGAETLAKQTASEITNSVSAKFPENAPPKLLYQTIKTVGSSTEQAAPALAQLVQNVNQARTESNTALAQQGYDAKQLASNSSVPVTKTPSAPVNTTSLSNPNIVSDANPKTIIADVSGKDNTGQDVALTRTYSKTYEQAIARGQSPEEANKQGWSSVHDGILLTASLPNRMCGKYVRTYRCFDSRHTTAISG
jgi:hypothetical protein